MNHRQGKSGDLTQSNEFQIQMDEEISVQSNFVNSPISGFEKGQSTQATFTTTARSMTTNNINYEQASTEAAASTPSESTEEVRSANNSDQSNPVIAAQIQVVIEINHSTDDSRPDEPDLGPGICEFHGFIQF